MNDVVEPTIERATAATIASLRAPAPFKACCMASLNLRGGQLVMALPDGRRLSFGDGATPVHWMQVKDYAFAQRVFAHGDIGLAESYMADEWDTPDLSAMLTFLNSNVDRIIGVFRGKSPMARLMHFMAHFSRENTREGSRKNILAHYDLGNRFYAKWLDGSMTYSAARFDRTQCTDLHQAQLEKYRALARHIQLQPGETVLEIGCGWGGFAEVAAKEFGARVTGLTISDEQHAFAVERMQREGLQDRVEIRLQDYRDVQGPFDKVASIEMFEAVGEKYWPAYFSKVAEVLKPGGRAGLQIITIRDDLFERYRSRVDFIQRYVFPGGMLPSLKRLDEETSRAGLKRESVDAFGVSYAETLAEWGRRFRAAWGDIRPLGFDERFKRLWQFYLSYCEAGFRTGNTDVVQIGLAKT
ncbi:MAG: cyclopropane-fatty-acyl-phospholipid synthase family protein [Hyphomonadaceae bacterium]|nr:cyclopropane-fatty-acyl-phospholipid synthase family protein [Hyphomonadaceae bacterium]